MNFDKILILKTDTFPSYAGTVQTYTPILTGKYYLQCWGARGGGLHDATRDWQEGYGGYSYGTKSLTLNDVLYICVGASGHTSDVYSDDISGMTVAQRNIYIAKPGYNGVEASLKKYNNEGLLVALSNAGGGATHIALNENYGILANYKSGTRRNSILLVAGGGGAADCFSSGGYGGGEKGGASTTMGTGTAYPGGGTQTEGGISTVANTSTDFYANGDFGSGGYSAGPTSNGNWDGGGKGGGGWYGGGGSRNNGNGGGGSGHVGSGVSGATIGGDKSFERPDVVSGNETGHAGNGYAKVTCKPYD